MVRYVTEGEEAMTTFKEVSEERYDEMLGCLPPVAWVGKGFLVGEPWDHNEAGQPRFAPFISLNGKFYEGDHPITVAEWRTLDPYAAVRGELVRG